MIGIDHTHGWSETHVAVCANGHCVCMSLMGLRTHRVTTVCNTRHLAIVYSHDMRTEAILNVPACAHHSPHVCIVSTVCHVCVCVVVVCVCV
jgi:hypothetical protein